MSQHAPFPRPDQRTAFLRSCRLGQNFLVDRALVSRLVAQAGIGRDDTVFEIGPGTGAITEVLADRAGRVVAVEKDPRLYRLLRDRLADRSNVDLHLGDFRRFPPPGRDWKVFASIPFNLTAHVVRTLVGRRPSPADAWLIVQRESAEKFTGAPRRSLFSILHGPWLAMSIVEIVPREAFRPVPSVAAALLHIVRRPVPFVEDRHGALYRKFAMYGFSGWKPNLRTRYRNLFSHEQWKRLSADLAFSPDATSTQLTLDQWVALFRYALRGVPELKWRAVLGTLGGAGP